MPFYRVLARIARVFGFGLQLTRLTPDLTLYTEYCQESKTKRRFYNIGAGLFYHPLWTNIDYGTEHYSSHQTYPFIEHNLMELKPLPIENDTAEIVYSSHVIEHLTDEAVAFMLKESHRILKQGGCIRLVTPDIELEYEAYKRNDIKFWYWTEYYNKRGSWEQLYIAPLSSASINQLFLEHFATQLSNISADRSAVKKYTDAEIIKAFSELGLEKTLEFFSRQCKYNAAFPGNHLNWWTYGKLASFLQKTGFSDYYRSGYGQSRFAPLRDVNYFDNTHPRISLFVEAIK